MKYENLNPEQKAEFHALREQFEQFSKEVGRMSATLYPETLIGFSQHAARCELLIEKIVSNLMENKTIAEITEETFNGK